ncbi:hypothetical protein VTJ04DRAFT_7763 [Mycothermus thermophilus]|uniref:uncharacterized protein n=1 Tax=Humicola insolens TaxID=85995 RepID=UPI003741E8CC
MQCYVHISGASRTMAMDGMKSGDQKRDTRLQMKMRNKSWLFGSFDTFTLPKRLMDGMSDARSTMSG